MNQTNSNEILIPKEKSRTQEKRERNELARRYRSMDRQEVSNVVIGPNGRSIHLGGTKFIYHERKVPGNYRTLWNYLNTTPKTNSKRQKALRESYKQAPTAKPTIIQATERKGIIASAKAKVKRLFNRKSS